jgi:hypothetical protein
MHSNNSFLTVPLIALMAILLGSCREETLINSTLVYNHDFWNFTANAWENGRFVDFNGLNLLGNYNNDEAALTVDNLPIHNVLEVTVEIMIHDTWDGNPDDSIGGPDIWYMKIDDQEVLRTTFSNTPCESLFCLKQSYPDNYLRQHNPKTGAMQTNLPGLCHMRTQNNYTSRYRITKLVRHNRDSVRITLGDMLVQNNSPNPKCDESWSVASMQVSALIVN